MDLMDLIRQSTEDGRVTRQSGFTRRDIAKMRDALKRHRITHNVPTEQIMQPRARRTHENKVRWPDVLYREPPKNQGVTRVSYRETEHPLITARRKQHPNTTRK